jgi:hypothetical protein
VFTFVLKGNVHVFVATFGVATSFVFGVRFFVMFVTEFEEMNGLQFSTTEVQLGFQTESH